MSPPKKKGTITEEEVGIKFLKPLELKQSGTSSVELKRDSKGATVISVKSYDEDVVRAMKNAVRQFDNLCKKYPDVT